MKKKLFSALLLFSFSMSLANPVPPAAPNSWYKTFIEGGLKKGFESLISDTMGSLTKELIVLPLIINPIKSLFTKKQVKDELDSLVDLSEKLKKIGLSNWKIKRILQQRVNNCLSKINKDKK